MFAGREPPPHQSYAPVPQSQMVMVQVRTLTGQLISMHCNSHETIFDVKQRLEREPAIGVAPGLQSLVADGVDPQAARDLPDSMPLYGPPPVTRLLIRLRTQPFSSGQPWQPMTAPGPMQPPPPAMVPGHAVHVAPLQVMSMEQPVSDAVLREREARRKRMIAQETYCGSLFCLLRTIYTMGAEERRQRVGRDFAHGFGQMILYCGFPVYFALDILYMVTALAVGIVYSVVTLLSVLCCKYKQMWAITQRHTIATNRCEHPACVCWSEFLTSFWFSAGDGRGHNRSAPPGHVRQ